MSVASRESTQGVFEGLSERFSKVKAKLRRPWRRSQFHLESKTEIPATDAGSVASFHSDPAPANEVQAIDWDDAQPELKEVDSFALPMETLCQMQEEEVEKREAVMDRKGIRKLRCSKRVGISAVAVIVAATILLRK